jgi:Flp pilus assembly protein TadB
MTFPFFEILAGAAVFLIAAAFSVTNVRSAADGIGSHQLPKRARANGMLRSIARLGVRRAGTSSAVDARYLRELKQANWHWIAGEPIPPDPHAPFWNIETLWAEKYLAAFTYACVTVAAAWLLLVLYELLPADSAVIASLAVAGMAAYFGWTAPDTALRSAAARRQRNIGLEMGYRLPELRSDVLAGRTVMSAMRELSRRPGGAFVEELRRVVLAFDVQKDEAAALAVLIDRNHNNEIVSEFVNQMTMAIVHGHEVNRVLNVLAAAAQQRLLQQVAVQGRLNAQEMGRPLAAGSVLILALLIMLPASFTIGSAMF